MGWRVNETARNWDGAIKERRVFDPHKYTKINSQIRKQEDTGLKYYTNYLKSFLIGKKYVYLASSSFHGSGSCQDINKL